MRQLLLSVTLSALLIGCGVLPPLDPVASEERTVRSASDTSRTITVPEGMVWYNVGQTRGLRFPPGTYVLEAEDDSYWYFHASSPLEFRVFNGGNVTDAQNIPGGIMLGKVSLSMVPAGGYIDAEGSKKMQVWKLGSDFLRREGRDWKKSF